MSGYIQSIQTFSITIASGSVSNTATISAVTTNNSIILFGGSDGTAAAQASRDYAYVTLTDTTTVTATRNNSTTDSCVVKGTVVEFTSSAVNVAAQYGTISLAATAASGTATITSVDTTKAAIFYLGMTTSNGSISTSVFTNVELTNATTVTAARTGSSGSVVISFCVLEFTTTVMKSVQQRTVTSTASTATTVNDTITAITVANTLILYGGISSNTSTPTNALSYLSLTSTTNVAAIRQGNASATRTWKYCVLEFQAGILNQAVQRGTIDLNAATSNTATITSVDTNQAAVNFCNFNTAVSSTTTIDRLLATMALTNATTATAAKNTATDDVLTSYEVVEFASASASASGFNPYYSRFIGRIDGEGGSV